MLPWLVVSAPIWGPLLIAFVISRTGRNQSETATEASEPKGRSVDGVRVTAEWESQTSVDSDVVIEEFWITAYGPQLDLHVERRDDFISNNRRGTPTGDAPFDEAYLVRGPELTTYAALPVEARALLRSFAKVPEIHYHQDQLRIRLNDDLGDVEGVIGRAAALIRAMAWTPLPSARATKTRWSRRVWQEPTVTPERLLEVALAEDVASRKAAILTLLFERHPDFAEAHDVPRLLQDDAVAPSTRFRAAAQLGDDVAIERAARLLLADSEADASEQAEAGVALARIGVADAERVLLEVLPMAPASQREAILARVERIATLDSLAPLRQAAEAADVPKATIDATVERIRERLGADAEAGGLAVVEDEGGRVSVAKKSAAGRLSLNRNR